MSSSRANAALLIRFLAGGAFNTAFGAALILLLMRVGASPLAANVGGYAGGLVMSFVVSRGFVFRVRGSVAQHLPRYLLAFAVSYLVNLGVLMGATRWGMNPYAAQLFAVFAYVVVMFTLCRLVVFQHADPATPVLTENPVKGPVVSPSKDAGPV